MRGGDYVGDYVRETPWGKNSDGVKHTPLQLISPSGERGQNGWDTSKGIR